MARDVSGWAFTSGVSFTFPAATTIPAGGRLVVAANATDFTAKYPGVTNFVAGWTGRLSNSSNKITLTDAAGTKIADAKVALRVVLVEARDLLGPMIDANPDDREAGRLYKRVSDLLIAADKR